MEGMHLAWHVLLLLRLGQLERAAGLLRQCRIGAAQTLRPLLAAAYRLALAEYLLAVQKDEGARPHVASALTWAEESGHVETEIRANLLLARLQLRAEEQDAPPSLEAAERAARRGGYRVLLVDALVLKGHAALLAGRWEQAQEVGREAYGLSAMAPCGYQWGQGSAAHLLGEVAYRQGQAVEAQHRAEEAVRVRRAIQDARVKRSEAVLTRIEESGAP